MFYRSRQPAAPLGDFVEYFWELRDAPAHAHESIVATGTLELVVNLQENEFRVYDSEHLANPRRVVLLLGIAFGG